MAARITPSGGKKPDKFMRDALILALHREAKDCDGRPTKRLYQIADALVKRAAEGDVNAIREIFDRVEGKPKQVNEHSGIDGEDISHSIAVQFVKP